MNPLDPRRPAERCGRRPGLLPPQLLFKARSPPAPPAAPGSGKRGRRRAGPRCRPLPSWPLPSPTPTAPAPHPRDPPGAARPPPGYTTRRGAARGEGKGGGRRPPALRAGDPERAAEGPGAAGPACRAAFGTLPPPLLSRPESVTGISFQHGGQEAAPRGENIPASPAQRRAGQGRRPSEEPRGRTAGSGAQEGRLGDRKDPRDDGVLASPRPRRQNPRPQVGLGWRVREDASSAQPRSSPPASGSRDTTRVGIH